MELSAINSYAIFLFLSFLVYKTYEPFSLALNNNEKFKKYELSKQYYIIKNLIKSVIINLQDKILILGHKFNIKFNKKIKILEV